MSTVKTDAITAVSTNGDLSLDGLGTGGVSIASTLKMTKGGDIASASPLVIDTDGNYFDVTGTTNFSVMTVESGNFFMLQFDGALTITHGSGIELPGAANLTTATGDRLMCYATAANTVEVMSVETEAAGGGGPYTFLGKSTASASASVNSPTLDATYKTIMIIGSGIIAATDDVGLDLLYSVNDGSSFITADYYYAVGGTKHDASVPSTGASGAASIYMHKRGGTEGLTTVSTDGAAFVMYIDDVGSTSIYKKAHWRMGYFNTEGTVKYVVAIGSGVYTGATTAINKLQFKFSSGNITVGTFEFYGILGA